MIMMMMILFSQGRRIGEKTGHRWRKVILAWLTLSTSPIFLERDEYDEKGK